MKVQYFGDEHDFRKYALLRSLARKFTIGVCWMLTPDDGRSDGQKRNYLKDEEWQGKSPEVFNLLRSNLVSETTGDLIKPTRDLLRTVRELVPNAVDCEHYVPDNKDERKMFHEVKKSHLREADLIFYDPDNGIEIKSCPKGRKNSSKYVFGDELFEDYAAAKSVIIYQHFPRLPHAEVIWQKREMLDECLPNTKTWAFETSDVVFLLAAHPQHVGAVESLEEDFQSLINNGLYKAFHRPK